MGPIKRYEVSDMFSRNPSAIPCHLSICAKINFPNGSPRDFRLILLIIRRVISLSRRPLEDDNAWQTKSDIELRPYLHCMEIRTLAKSSLDWAIYDGKK